MPEQLLPEELHPLACQRCELHQHGSRLIWGEGNPKAPLFIILDNPGAREDKEGQPFLCGTRKTLQKAALASGFNLKQLYLTYILKCRPRKAYDKPTARASCSKYLAAQLKTNQPKLIFCLGDVACQTFFTNPQATVKHLRGKIHFIKGYPTISSYHPLAIRRRPVLQPYFLADWQLAATYLFSPP